MTVAALPTRATYVDAGDTATLYALPFQYLSSSQVRVSRWEDDDETVLSGFTVTGDGRATPPTGKVQLTDAVAASIIEVRRVTDLTQPATYTDREDFPSDLHQDTSDREMMAIQEQAAELARAQLVPRGETGGVLPTATERAGLFRAWDAEGQETVSSGTGADDGLRTDLAAGGGGLLVGLLSLGVGAVLRSLLAWWRDQPLTPESFGAAGDGATNDAAAFSALITAALAFGLPVRFKSGVTYGLGTASWTGNQLSFMLNGNRLVIDGNGATLKLLVQPSQVIMASMAMNKKALFRFIGDATNRGFLEVRRLGLDLNGIECAGIVADRLEVKIEHNRFTGGGYTSAQAGLANFTLLRCSGCWNYNYVRGGLHATQIGHTDVNAHSFNFVCIGNDMGGLNGDGIVGCFHRAYIGGNFVDGCFSGFVTIGFGTNGAQSYDVTIEGNTALNFTSAGYQSDISVPIGVGAYRPTRITVRDNKFAGATGAEQAILAESLSDSTISGNLVTNCGYGVVLDGAWRCSVFDNKLTGSTANVEYSGIRARESSLAGSSDVAADLQIHDNLCSGFSFGIRVPAGTEIAVVQNRTIGGAVGIYFEDGATGRVEQNDCSGASTYDIQQRSIDATFRHNQYSKAYQTRFALAVAAGVITVGRWDHYQLFEGSDVDITTISGGRLGQDVRFYCSTAHQTFKNGAGIIPKGAVDTTPAANGLISFTQSSAGLWLETGRSY